MIGLDAEGDCFETAARMIIPELNLGTGLPLIKDGLLVHGIPTLQRPPFSRHRHAWVEVRPETVPRYLAGEKLPEFYNYLVYDHSNGKGISKMPGALYYTLGRIDCGENITYTPAEAKKLIQEHGHYGVWHELPSGVL